VRVKSLVYIKAKSISKRTIKLAKSEDTKGKKSWYENRAKERQGRELEVD